MVYREDTDVYEARVNGTWRAVLLTQDWTTFSLTSLQSGWTAPTLRYHKTGDQVELDLAFTNPTLSTDSAGNMADITIGNVPPRSGRPTTSRSSARSSEPADSGSASTPTATWPSPTPQPRAPRSPPASWCATATRWAEMADPRRTA
jgi:hypothetical protein